MVLNCEVVGMEKRIEFDKEGTIKDVKRIDPDDVLCVPGCKKK